MKWMTKHTDGKGFLLGALILLVLSISSPGLYAAQMTSHDVRSAVETWVRTVTADARPDASVIEMQPYQVDGRTVGYIAHLSGGGFCLCGADDLVLPVYYYSPRGRYDPGSPGQRYVLAEIDERTRVLQEGLQKQSPEFLRHRKVLSDRAAAWRDLAGGRVPQGFRSQKEGPTDVEPDLWTLDLSSHWHQDSPYNDQCPELTPGEERTKVGAVATAMAQIMYFWQWPSVGEGQATTEYEYRWRSNWDSRICPFDPDIPDDPLWEDRLRWVHDDKDPPALQMKGYWDESLYLLARDIDSTTQYRDALKHLWDDLTKVTESQTQDPGATTYDWSLLENEHADPPDAGDAEAARLCYQAGVTVGMTYGLISSEVSVSDAKYALKDHFRFDDDIKHEGKNINNITEEIQWSRPVLFGGEDPDQISHAWVIYGYNKGTDPDRQFLVNMGWGGQDDGWYTCDNIAYHLSQKQIIRIAPEDAVQFVGNVDHGNGSPDHPYQDMEEALATAPDSVTLIFRAGTQMSFTADTLVLDRPMVLKGKMILGE